MISNYDEYLDALTEVRIEKEYDMMREEHYNWLDLCAINGWSPEEYSFDEYLEDASHE